MNPTLSSAVVSAVVALIIFFGSKAADRRSQAATNALAATKLASEGKAVDLTVLTTSIAELEKRVDSLSDDLVDEKKARMRAESRASDAEQRARDAERRAGIAEERASELARRAALLEKRVSQLEETLRANNIAVPPLP